MSDPLEDLPPAGTLQNDDLLYVVQDGNSRQATAGAFRIVPIQLKTTSYTLALEDTYVRMNSTGALTLTVPDNASVAIPIGTQITVVAANTGKVTVAAASGVTVLTNETYKLRKQGSAVTLTKVDANAWDLAGDVELA